MAAWMGLSAIDLAWLIIVVITFILGFMTLIRDNVFKRQENEDSNVMQRQHYINNSVFALFLCSLLSELGGWVITTYPRPVSGAAAAFNPVGALQRLA